MKLAEALLLRADQQKKMEQLRQRLVGSAKVQEGDEPPEDPAQLLVEMERAAEDLLRLIQQINKTNSATAFAPGKSLSDALAERDVLMLRRNAYADLAKAASVVQARTSRSEVKFVGTVRVADMQEQVNALSKTYRETDARIQELNWRTELLEE